MASDDDSLESIAQADRGELVDGDELLGEGRADKVVVNSWLWQQP